MLLLLKYSILIFLGCLTILVQADSGINAHVHYPRNGGFVVRSEEDDDMQHFVHSEFPDHRLRVKQPKLCADDVEQWSGYIDLPNGRHMFFWFFESKVESNDVILWLNGGPGCTSITGLSMELGPCRITNETGSPGLTTNPYAWNDKASVIFLDQPINVGFSYGEMNDTVTDSIEGSHDVYTFLQIWFDAFQKEVSEHNLHIAGESYAGRYIPLIASYTMEQNQKNERQVPLKSVVIGNGVTNPYKMYESYYDFVCTSEFGHEPIVNETACATMLDQWPTCSVLLEACANNQSSNSLCSNGAVYSRLTQLLPYLETGLSAYNIEFIGEYPEDSWKEAYFNQESVRSELGVSSSVSNFTGCNTTVLGQFTLTGDTGKPAVSQVVELLDKYNIPVLIYAGDLDFICNWVYTERWTSDLEWSNKDQFKDQTLQPWYQGDNIQAGLYRSFDKFTFATIGDAGHYVPYDQPEASLAMINAWLDKGQTAFKDSLSHSK